MTGKKRIIALSLALAALAFNLFLLWLYYQGPQPKRLIGDENYYVRVGTAVFQGFPPNHDLLWPPLYGELLGRFFLLFGNRLLFAQLFQVVLWGLTAFFFWRILLRISPSPLARRASLILLLFCPELAAFSHYFWPETVHLFLVMGALWLIIEFPGRLWSSAAVGALFGLALNTKHLLKLFLPVLLVALLISADKIPFQRKLKLSTVGVLVLLLTVFPLALNTWRHHGRFSLPDSSVFSVWAGLSDKGRHFYDDDTGRMMGEYLNTGPDIWTRNKITKARILEKIRQDGPGNVLINQVSKQYFRVFSVKTFFTTQLAGGELHAYSFEAPAIAGILRLWAYAFHGFLLIAGAAGLAYMTFSRKNPAVLFCLFILYHLGVFLINHVVARHALPILPMLAYFAGLSVERMFSRWKSSPHGREFLSVGKFRDILAASLAACMAFISLGPLLLKF